MNEINSASNRTFKYFCSLLTKKGRDLKKEYIAEGIKSVDEAISSDREISALIVRRDLVNHYRDIKTSVYVIPENLADKLSDTKTPQGVFAVLKMHSPTVTPPKKNGIYIYCDKITDPGNLGTIIRTADSAGFDGVLLSPECVECHNPKTVRSCMGSFFRTEIYEDIDHARLKDFKEHGTKIYGGILSPDSADYRNPDYSGTVIIAVGNESNGISPEIATLCTPVMIPIYGKAESLNAAVAASILMYEAANKRR